MASRSSAVPAAKQGDSSPSSTSSPSTGLTLATSTSYKFPSRAAPGSSAQQAPFLPPLLSPDAPVFNTQIINFPIGRYHEIWKPRSKAAKIWSQFLDIVEQSPGFQRLYYGKVVDIELLQGMTQIHIVKDTLEQHFEFLKSNEYKKALKLLDPLIDGTSPGETIIRHGVFANQSDNPRALGPNTPFSGTAIYKVNDPYAFQGAWQLWSTIIPKTKGCTGVTGGWLVDEKRHGSPYNFLVYVGWETMELHHEGHLTPEYRRESVILEQGNDGYREYGHVKFFGERKKKSGATKL